MDSSPPGTGALARAVVHRLTGDHAAGLAAAEAAYAEAGNLIERAQAAALRTHFTLRSGNLAGVLKLADTLSPLMRAHGGEACFEYLRSVALAASELGRIDLALPYAMEVHALAEADGGETVRAQALMALAACFERMGDPWQAERLMRDALALTRVSGTPRDLFIALNNVCAVLIGAFYLLRGESTRAEAAAALERALPLAREMHALQAQIDERFVHVHMLGNLGEILLHVGDADESRQLLDAALAIALEFALPSQSQRVRCSLAEWALYQGQPEAALADMSTLLSEGVVMVATQIRAHHAMYIAARQLGRSALALEHLEHRTELERQRAVQQLRAQSEQFITRVEAEQSRHEADHARQRANEMEQHALRDQLTGLGNRREVAERLPRLLAEADAAHSPLALAMLDLDHFKRINDRFGHLVGDQVLVTVAQMLRERLRGTDLLARTGGEEFLAVLPDATPARAREVCERIRAHMEAHDWSGIAPGLKVTVSVGLASAPPCEEAVLMARADAALYRAKARGRNRIEGA